MKRKNLKKIFAAFIASVSLLAFTGCKAAEEGDNTANTGPEIEGPSTQDPPQIGGDGDGSETPPSGSGEGEKPVTPPSGSEEGEKPVTPPSGSGEEEKPVTPPSGSGEEEKPVIPVNPVADAVKITKVKGDLEAAYVTWEIDENAKWYNVYCKAESASDETYSKLDAPLVRKYKDYFRADAVGLKEGKYSFKVVPVDADGAEVEKYASSASNITVKAHERYGFGFVGGTSSGAYNDDGTLRDNARVIYVTDKNKETVSLEINGAEQNPCVGIQGILSGLAKGKETRPLAIRFVGNVGDSSTYSKGDLELDTKKTAVGVTLEGVGSDATANGWGIRLKKVSNVEIRNLGFINCHSYEGDCVGLQQENNHVWVHNCDFFYGDAGSDKDQVKGDGSLDSKGSDYVTHSYNHFWDSGKCCLLGNGTTEELSGGGVTHLTYHHNWFDHSDSRHPRIRTATVHIFNNYFDGNSKYGVGVTKGASAFVEGNYFRSTARMRPMMAAAQGTDISVPNEEGKIKSTFSGEDGGTIKSFKNVIVGDNVLLRTQNDVLPDNNGCDCWEASSRDEVVPSSFKTLQGGHTYNNFDTDSEMYSYTADSAEDAKTKVEQFAGRIDGGDIKWTFDNQTEDGNSTVIQPLKDLLTNYKSSVAEIAGETVSGGNGGSSGGSTEPDEPTKPVDPVIPADGDISSYFTDGKASNSAFTVEGNKTNSSLSLTINALGETLESGLKMESSTSVKFSVSETAVLVLYVDGAVGKKIKINGTSYAVTEADGDKVVKVTLEAGSYEIKKGDQMNLWYATLTKAK